MAKLSLIVLDTETTTVGIEGDVIEASFFRLRDNKQKTWYLKAVHEDKISPEALEVNGHKLEDITWKTEEGRQKYRLPEEVVPEIENWLYEDGCAKLDRIMVGHNINFDYLQLEELWRRHEALETFPFSFNKIDTQMMCVFLDWLRGVSPRRFNLGAVVKRLGLEKRKAHKAENDVLMTVQLLKYLEGALGPLVSKSGIPILGEGEAVEEEEELPSVSEEEAEQEHEIRDQADCEQEEDDEL